MADQNGPKGIIVDEMLIKLGRFLRMAGYHVIIPRGRTDREIASIAMEKDLLLLTRDKDLSNMKGPLSLKIISDNIDEQMKEMTGSKYIGSIRRETTRCPACDSILDMVTDIDIISQLDVPQKVKERQEIFFTCPDCEKIYWKGKHWDRILQILLETGLEPIPYT